MCPRCAPEKPYAASVRRAASGLTGGSSGGRSGLPARSPLSTSSRSRRVRSCALRLAFFEQLQVLHCHADRVSVADAIAAVDSLPISRGDRIHDGDRRARAQAVDPAVFPGTLQGLLDALDAARYRSAAGSAKAVIIVEGGQRQVIRRFENGTEAWSASRAEISREHVSGPGS
jgi:hypothetical protein